MNNKNIKNELRGALKATSSNKTKPDVSFNLTSSNKIVKMVEIALENGDYKALITLGDILHKIAEKERLLDTLTEHN